MLQHFITHQLEQKRTITHLRQELFYHLEQISLGVKLGAEAEEEKLPEEKLLFAKNKWLIAHEEGGEEGAFIGLTGKNISVDDLVI